MQRKAYDCGIACFAMAMNMTYEQAMECFPGVGRFLFKQHDMNDDQREQLLETLKRVSTEGKSLEEIEKTEPDLINMPHIRQALTIEELHLKIGMLGRWSLLAHTYTSIAYQAIHTVSFLNDAVIINEFSNDVIEQVQGMSLYDSSTFLQHLELNPYSDAILIIPEELDINSNWPIEDQVKALVLGAGAQSWDKDAPTFSSFHSVFWNGEDNKLYNPREKEQTDKLPEFIYNGIIL